MTESETAPDPGPAPAPQGGDLVRRHSLFIRLWHWFNAMVVMVMLMSGLMIFNAHPRLYWGHYGANSDPSWFDLGQLAAVPFPGWITIPSHYSLADARLWHLGFGWLLVMALLAYLGWALATGRRRRLLPRGSELRPAHLWHDLRAHARLQFPTGAAALHYNVLQKLAYSTVLLILLPGIVLTGLGMAPAIDAAWPWLLDRLGGRQSARSLHFLCAAGLVAFLLVHVAMVMLAGPRNELRAMLSGWYRLPPEREDGR